MLHSSLSVRLLLRSYPFAVNISGSGRVWLVSIRMKLDIVIDLLAIRLHIKEQVLVFV